MENLTPDEGIISNVEVLKRRGYKILTKLGEGSYAKVYLGEFESKRSGNDKKIDPIKLAVKIISMKRGRFDFTKKFLPRELNILCRINHPHIIHIHSILQIGESYYIFMRFAEQGDLLDFILKTDMVHENQARLWTRQIALALQYLHELNIAHRDLKCENILITINFNAKLCDFGFARYTVTSNRRPVLSETYCGSLSYASPEILHGRPYDPRISDIWSFGVIIYVMLNKSMPFVAISPKALRENQMLHNFKFRSKVASLLSNEVKVLVKNLLEPDPVKRYTIEGVLNSDWIAMDERLTELSTLELTALQIALEFPLAPPENLSLGKVHLVDKKPPQLVTNDQNELGVDIIKSYKPEVPRVSKISKMPSKSEQEIAPEEQTILGDLGLKKETTKVIHR